MAIHFTIKNRLRCLALATVMTSASALGLQAAATNPLLDFQSTSMTNAFRNDYSAVHSATVNVEVPYGLDDAQKYDVYLPESRDDAPVIVMIHGGAWTGGDKQDENVAEAKAGYWVARGYIFVSMNYRLAPKSDPLIQAADVALGLASIQKNVANWGGDKNKIVLMGSGAGGHLAALLSSNPSLASDQGATPWAGAVVLETSALNIPAIMNSQHDALYDKAFGSNVEFWEDSSPTHLVDSSGVPILVVCSSESEDNSCAKANSFKQAADNSGVSVTVSVQSLSPTAINNSLGVSSSYTDSVNAFIQSVI